LDNGPARDLLLKWADNPDNLILLTDYEQCSLRCPKHNNSTTSNIDEDADDEDISSNSLFSASAQLMLKWCYSKSMGVEMGDVVSVDVLVPHRAPLRGKELESFLKDEERIKRRKREEEERKAMLREVELARGRLRLGEDESNIKDTTNKQQYQPKEVLSSPLKKTKFDSNLFLKFSKPLFMQFSFREEAVGIGQEDSVAKYGVNESVGRSGEVLEDEYGISVLADRFVDIITGIDPQKFAAGGINTWKSTEDNHWKNRGGLGFGMDGRPVLTTSKDATASKSQGDKEDSLLDDNNEQLFEAADLSEGKGIIRGRNDRPHLKVTTVSRRIEVLAEIIYVPLEGKVDARAARQTVRALQPRQVVILGGAKPTTSEEKQWMDALRKSANIAMFDDFDDEEDDEEEELWGHTADPTSQQSFQGEMRLLADAVRDLRTNHSGSFLAPANQETIELNVGHAAFSVRLIDTPYLTKQQQEQEDQLTTKDTSHEDLQKMLEPFEVKMAECTVSLLDCVATGQKVAADGSIVLAPRIHSKKDQHHRPSLLLSDGDVLLTDLRAEVTAQGMKAEYSAHTGYQQLLVNNKVIVKKEHSTGKISIEGSLDTDFYVVRNLVCSQYVTL